MALDPKRRAGWILDLLLQAFAAEFNLHLAVTERQYNHLAQIIQDLIDTTEPTNAEANLSEDRTIN